MTNQNSSQPSDLYFEPIVEGCLSNTRFLRRGWLTEEIGRRVHTHGSRFVLLTAEPRLGKNAYMAQHAAGHTDWPR